MAELASLAAQMYERARGDLPDEDPDAGFSRTAALKLAITFGGAGVLPGDLTAECAAIVGRGAGCAGRPGRERRRPDAGAAVSRRAGGGDAAAGPASDLLPERAGQPVKAWVHVSLADLMLLDGSSALLEQWTAQVRAQWAARRAWASQGGGEGGAWLDGDAAEAVTCDAAMAPLVTGDVNIDALEDISFRLCVELDRHRHGVERQQDSHSDTTAAPDTTAAWAALEQAVIGKAVDLLSGPGGLASLPASAAAERAAGRAEPAAGHRVFRVGPGRDPQRGDPAGPQVPVGGRLRPARVGVRRAPRQAQETYSSITEH